MYVTTITIDVGRNIHTCGSSSSQYMQIFIKLEITVLTRDGRHFGVVVYHKMYL